MNENFPTTIGTWVATLGDWAVSKGWGKNKRSILEKLALVHAEVSEVTDVLRTGASAVEIFVDTENAPQGVPIELADVVMRIMVLCAEEGIDLEAAMRMKLDFNRRRDYRHGNRIY